VANACTDTTDSVLAEFRNRLPLRTVCEAAPGLSHARNHAVRVATGEYMLWIDDDVFVEPDWMFEYVAAFRQHPAAAFFGGPIEPLFEGTPPRWILESLIEIGSTFARRELGDRPLRLAKHTLPYGANFAVKTAVQKDYSYDPRLGQRPGCLALGEETDVLFAMLTGGHTGWWVPRARVRHFIPAYRQSWSHVKSHWRAQGEAMASYVSPGEAPRFLGRPLWLWRWAIRTELTYRLDRLTGSKSQSIGKLARARVVWAMLRSVTRTSPRSDASAKAAPEAR